MIFQSSTQPPPKKNHIIRINFPCYEEFKYNYFFIHRGVIIEKRKILGTMYWMSCKLSRILTSWDWMKNRNFHQIIRPRKWILCNFICSNLQNLCKLYLLQDRQLSLLFSRLVMSNSLLPHETVAHLLLCSWDSPGKNMGVSVISFSGGSSRPRDRTPTFF